MDGHPDKRVMRSRKVMIDAFEHLLRAKPYEDITVTDIAREADVDRKTFYKHFGSIDGLLAYILDRHIAEIVESTHALLFRDGELLEQDLDVRLRTFFDMVNVSLMTNISLNRRVFECVPFDLLLSCVKASMLEELRRYGAVSARDPRRTARVLPLVRVRRDPRGVSALDRLGRRRAHRERLERGERPGGGGHRVDRVPA